MEPNNLLPFYVALDDYDDPGDVIDAMALGRFTAGIEPYARTLRLNRVRRDAPLLPPGTEPMWSAVRDGRRSVLAAGEGWTLRAVRWRGNSAELTVTAVNDELARSVLADATVDAVEDGHPLDTSITVGFWNQTRLGRPNRLERDIAVEPWPDIRGNYTAGAAVALDALMGIDATTDQGRLLLLHGPPATGKTTALRALAHAWRRWCRVETILDPERLFEEPAYLMNVALGEDDDADDERRRWRLLVFEDCDELVRSDAERGTGQSLARLLNVTDGLVGQGLRVLLGITTNEPLTALHPVVVRAGRCLAEIYIGPLSAAEARRWFGCAGSSSAERIPAEGLTLAELFARQGTLRKVEQRDAVSRPGQYL